MEVTFPEALGPLIQQIEGNAYACPPVAIEAARQLLKQCHQPDHLAYAYEQLGFAHLILGEYRLSCLFYEQARGLEAPNMYVLANLAHARHELGDREEAVHLGRQALRLKDEQACRAADPNANPNASQQANQGARPLQRPHHGPVQLVSFSLYGQQARYCEMAVLNVLAARRHLPEFICRFYVDDSVPPALVHRLNTLGAQCFHMGAAGQRIPPTLWRFLAMDDAQADCVLVRDVDALIDARDAWCVRDWRESGLAFHVMRDDCCHTELILAGMFGIRSGVIPGISALVEQYIQSSGAKGWQRYADQLFLRHQIWPAIREHALTHDTIYGYGTQVQALAYQEEPGHGPRSNFIGANHATFRIACTLDEPLPTGTLLQMRVHDAAGTLICRHAMQEIPRPAGNGQSASGPPGLEWQIYLPRLYAAPVESGQWDYQLHAHVVGQAGLGEGSIDPVVLGLQSG